MLSSGGMPEAGGLHQFLLQFINEAAAANIVAGVQVNLLNELAAQFTGSCAPSTVDTLPEQRQPDAGAAAAAVSTLQRASAAEVPLQATAVEQLRLPQSTSQPQLHIQPLNLSAGLGEASTSQQEAVRCNAPQLNTPVSHPAAEGLSDHAAAMLAFTSSMTGTFDAASAAAAAAALLQQQKLPYTHPAPGQQQLVDPCAAAPSLLGTSTELLQALGYAAEASAGADLAMSAAEASAYASKTPAGARKQRFTREQHAAILESVERNYAQYPSRYTELVIKEMQARFPGIELNNACVRKIKFRANEANKQHLSVHFQTELVAMLPDYQAADAAQGLVGLASAAAAGALADLTGLQQGATGTPDSAAADMPAVCAAVVKAEEHQGGMQPEASSGAASPSAIDPAAAAATATEGGSLRAQHSNSPETVSISTDPVSAVLLAGSTAPQQQQHKEVDEQQELPQQGAAVQAAAVAAAADRACSPASAKLLLKLPEAVTTAVAGEGDGTIDSATAAAAEAMHLLSGISSSGAQQQQQQVAALAGQVGAATGSVEGAAAAAGSKRKRESAAGAVAVEGVSASRDPAAEPLPEQVTEALSAAAELAGASSADKGQPALQQSAALPVSETYLPAAYDQQQMLLQQQEQQQQQQALMQQLLQLQQQQQPAWDMAYASQMAPLELQMQQQQQQQAMQMQLSAGLGSSSGGHLAVLQQQMHVQMQAPVLGAVTASAAAAGGGHQPAAKRQRLSGAQMAELIASVKHHVQVNPERYTHCVIKDMKEKYPDLELNMGQIRKIKFRTLGNANNGKHSASAGLDSSSAIAFHGADFRSGSAAAAAAAGCSAADDLYTQ